MEWFAVTSAATTSLAWAGADARARGAWVSLADVCRQTMTEGRIRAGRSQMTRVCRLARVGVGDLRAAINAGLVVPDGDDLVLAGWDHGKEREAARAAQRARANRQRQQGQESPDQSEPTPDSSTVLPDSVREPFANATPNSATEERRGEQTRAETSPPSPQGVTTLRSRAQDGTNAATAATAQAAVPVTVRERFANATPNGRGVVPGAVRERIANAAEEESQDSSGNSPEALAQLAPKRSRPTMAALRTAALNDHALGIITALGGCLRGPGGTDYTPEWHRELAGIDAREVLAICTTAREPIRLPSGLHRVRDEWRSLSTDERRRIVHEVCTAHAISMEKRPAATEQPP